MHRSLNHECREGFPGAGLRRHRHRRHIHQVDDRRRVGHDSHPGKRADQPRGRGRAGGTNWRATRERLSGTRRFRPDLPRPRRRGERDRRVCGEPGAARRPTGPGGRRSDGCARRAHARRARCWPGRGTSRRGPGSLFLPDDAHRHRYLRGPHAGREPVEWCDVQCRRGRARPRLPGR